MKIGLSMGLDFESLLLSFLLAFAFAVRMCFFLPTSESSIRRGNLWLGVQISDFKELLHQLQNDFAKNNPRQQIINILNQECILQSREIYERGCMLMNSKDRPFSW